MDHIIRSKLSKRRTNLGPSAQTDWSSIPDDILTSIAGKIVSADDYVRFSAVCRYWHSLAADHHNNQKPQFQPLFMSVINPGSKRITFRNPSSGKTLTVGLPPEISGTTRFWGSPFGWLIAGNRTRHSVRLSLFNPFTGAFIRLPSYYDSVIHPDQFNAFLTANPDSDPGNCVVVLHLGNGQASFLRLGRDWCSSSSSLYSTIDGFTYFRGTLYGILSHYSDHFVHLLRFTPHDAADIFAHHHQRQSFNCQGILGLHTIGTTQKHIFVLNGELCLCVRRVYLDGIITRDVEIFKIDPWNGDLTPVKSLGDHCLFLGDNYSFACKASYPRGEFFEEYEDGELVSDLVFISYWTDIMYYKWDVEVWDMVRPSRVCRKRDSQAPLPDSLWIVPSLTM